MAKRFFGPFDRDELEETLGVLEGLVAQTEQLAVSIRDVSKLADLAVSAATERGIALHNDPVTGVDANFLLGFASMMETRAARICLMALATTTLGLVSGGCQLAKDFISDMEDEAPPGRTPQAH